MKNRESVIEGIGLLLVLLSFGWQCIEEDAQSNILICKIIQLESEIKNCSTTNMYATYVCSDYYKNDSVNDIQDINNKIEINNAGIKKINAELKDFEDKSSWVTLLRRLLFIIGSALIILPKFYPVLKSSTNKKVD